MGEPTGPDASSGRSYRLVLGAMAASLTLILAGAPVMPKDHAFRSFGFGAGLGSSPDGTSEKDPVPVPRPACGPGSKPETDIQGRVSAADISNGRAAKGYSCNMRVVGREGTLGGFRVHRYIDKAGHECAFYDTTAFIPSRPSSAYTDSDLSGTHVLDMSKPSKPVRTADLPTPAMRSPHESLSLNVKRGLLASDMGAAATMPGFVDIYDVSTDCRSPELKSSLPIGPLGHEGSFSPDGKTFYATAGIGFFVGRSNGTITAIDVSDPANPVPLWTTGEHASHGLNISADGNTMYFADLGSSRGLTILDVSEIQKRVPNPQVKVISHLTWPTVSIPQTAIPVTINRRPYLVEVDEFAANAVATLYGADGSDPNSPVGAARIIDIANPKRPRIVSNIRLEVNTRKARAGPSGDDPGASTATGYSAHYCAVPRQNEPGIVACSFILSGLRVFDIRDPKRPKEIAYFNPPMKTDSGSPILYSAVSGPAFAPERGEIWYTDANYGFFVLRLTNWPLTRD